MVEQKVGSDAFRLEYKSDVPENVLLDDVISYLGEYRFGLQKYSYNLAFKDGKLTDPHRDEPMESLAERAILNKLWEGKSSSRERAEKEGFTKLDAQLDSSTNGDTVVWASPPGPKEEGYGDYGFIFIGKINVQNLREKKVNMIAIRVENPTISQFNKAVSLLTGEKTDNKIPEEFLRNPKVLRENLDEGYVDAVLGMSFDFQPKKGEKEKFMKIIERMYPLFKEFINLTNSKRVKALNAMENLFLKLKNDCEDDKENIIFVRQEKPLSIAGIMGDFGHKPPKVAGSCGSTSNKNSLTSSNLFARGSGLNGLDGLNEDQEWFHCPKCDFQADGPIGDTCPGCKLTKEEYAQETGINCD